jgi:hypothetical protein
VIGCCYILQHHTLFTVPLQPPHEHNNKQGRDHQTSSLLQYIATTSTTVPQHAWINSHTFSLPMGRTTTDIAYHNTFFLQLCAVINEQVTRKAIRKVRQPCAPVHIVPQLVWNNSASPMVRMWRHFESHPTFTDRKALPSCTKQPSPPEERLETTTFLNARHTGQHCLCFNLAHRTAFSHQAPGHTFRPTMPIAKLPTAANTFITTPFG